MMLFGADGYRIAIRRTHYALSLHVTVKLKKVAGY